MEFISIDLWLAFHFFRTAARDHPPYGLLISLDFLAVILGLFRSFSSSEFLPPGFSPVEPDHWNAGHHRYVMGQRAQIVGIEV